MSEISPIGRPNVDAVGSPGRNNSPAPASATDGAQRGDDSVEFSPEAQRLSRFADVPLRQNLIERVQAQIQTDSYVTDDKLEAALDELINDLTA